MRFVILAVFSLTTTIAAILAFPIDQQNDDENEVDFPDYDVFSNLLQIGDKVFGYPRNSTGKK